MMDGHFGLQRLSKVDDPEDVSLVDGNGLFPPNDRYNDFVRNTVAYSEEVSINLVIHSNSNLPCY